MADIVALRSADEFGEAPNLMDIPLMLERTAARIRAGECGDVQRVAMVIRASDASPNVYGFGDGPSCQIFEDLHLGAAWLLAALEH